ncbi:MAG: GIY-YIG nuclease family protein [Desulfovibrio sp.]|nr:GIY-YIG nuclease family protein [Desulfovibrio sp.]
MTKTDNDRSWHVYLLECSDGTYYCGVATDMARRLEQHNGLLPGGAKYTRTRRPVRVIASRLCADKSGACRLEYAVKSAPREKKLDVLFRLSK